MKKQHIVTPRTSTVVPVHPQHHFTQQNTETCCSHNKLQQQKQQPQQQTQQQQLQLKNELESVCHSGMAVVDDKYGNNVRSFFCSSGSSTGKFAQLDLLALLGVFLYIRSPASYYQNLVFSVVCFVKTFFCS